MVAIQSRIYAIIHHGKLHCVFTKAELPEWNENDIIVVDITDINPQPKVGWIYQEGIFAEPSSIEFNLSTAIADKLVAISKDCEQAILAGFTSLALGSSHLYPSNDRDQVNLSGTIQKSLLPTASPSDYYPFLCADTNGLWDYRFHTATQIQQVGVDAYNAILQARIKHATLQVQISAATTQAAIDAIQW